jgi:hypothetical protein
MELAAIIGHLKFMRYEEKKIETAHSDDLNYESVGNLSKKVKKL